MIMLDYTGINRRWGESGLKYSSWESYAFALGYLSNINHYNNCSNDGLIDLHIERNDLQGADDKEGRIHFYGEVKYLEDMFPDWYDCSSKGNGRHITKRINSTPYMQSLIENYGFSVKSVEGRLTKDIFPPEDKDLVFSTMEKFIINNNIGENINNLKDTFLNGYNS